MHVKRGISQWLDKNINIGKYESDKRLEKQMKTQGREINISARKVEKKEEYMIIDWYLNYPKAVYNNCEEIRKQRRGENDVTEALPNF